MDSINRPNLVLAAVALSMLIHIECSPMDNVNIDVTTPCHDSAEAINRLFRYLPEQMPLESRCKRYAVFLSTADTEGVANEVALLQAAALREDILEGLYREISTLDLASRYMTTIDSYRTTHLEPAFMDLIECLRGIEIAEAKSYLNDPSLIMIVDLYKLALGPPAHAIYLQSIDLSGFSPAFRDILRNLFAVHDQNIRHVSHRSPSLMDLNELSSSYLPQERQAELNIAAADNHLRQKELQHKQQQRFREQHSKLVREKDRIRKKEKRDLQLLQLQLGHEELTDKRLEKLERDRIQSRERQRRYREQHAQRLMQKRHEEQQRWRELKERIPMMKGRSKKSRQDLDLTLERQWREQSTDSSPVSTQLVPNILESSIVEQQADRPSHQSDNQGEL